MLFEAVNYRYTERVARRSGESAVTSNDVIA